MSFLLGPAVASCRCARHARNASVLRFPFAAQRLFPSGGQVRANAYQEAGWTPTWTLTEDFALGMEMKRNGWHCRYLNQYLAVGEVPPCAELCCTAMTLHSCRLTSLLSCTSALAARQLDESWTQILWSGDILTAVRPRTMLCVHGCPHSTIVAAGAGRRAQLLPAAVTVDKGGRHALTGFVASWRCVPAMAMQRGRT